jgi:hypothetical protein
MSDTSKWLSLLDRDLFKEIFIDELGWNQPSTQGIVLTLNGEKITLNPIASFKGIQVWSCSSVPNARIQRDIDKEISKISAERLVIYFDDFRQIWRWPMSREATGKGIVRLVSHEHFKGEKTLSLLQRLQLISISLTEPEPSLVEMLLRMRKAFDAEQVTKKFYKEFSTHQKKLVSQLKGLDKNSDKEWYSALLLNRIMFIYFMQWKGFMDGNQNYLGDRLLKVRQIQGPNKFYGFFKDFLLPLFHQGLGAGQKITVPPEIAKIVGEIPYVNGGIFSEHELEEGNDIDIPDTAFEAIFEFFDNYQWHLDSRPTGARNEINPDVLGYVFEQFINNKDLGAYYTKEDITDYMTTNTLVIRFLQKVIEVCRINLLRPVVQNPDRYIWPSLKFGGDKLAESSIDNLENLLPGETLVEGQNRLEHLQFLREQLADGKIDTIQSLISFNLDLEQLAIDVIDNLDTSEDVMKIWNVLSDIKVVDPTCGSGAFLFAALSQLEGLYSVILDVAEIHAKSSKNPALRALLESVSKHPNRNYFVLKHAAQKNLYGVDIMKEATEIARLRLFLKLISAIDSYQDIEPLPDLEFNIKSGNLLIGIPTTERLPDYFDTFDASMMIDEIQNQVTHLADLWENFQLSQEFGHEKATKAKKMLASGTSILKSTLDKLLYDKIALKNKETIEEWKDSSIPFHWFVEFPDVFQQGGFDVVIGNPPYIKKSKVNYDLTGHFTSSCPDIYAMCMERASLVTSEGGTLAMIVMSNLAFSERYTPLRELLTKKFGMRFISGYAKRPSSLFVGVQVRNAIFIGTKGEKSLFSAPMKRWTKEFRPHLMPSIRYTEVSTKADAIQIWPFITSSRITDLLTSYSGTFKQDVISRGPEYDLATGTPVWNKSETNATPLFYSGTAYNWISCFKIPPPAEDGQGKPVVSSTLSVIWFKNEETRDIAFTLFVSKWMFAWWCIYGDDFHVTKEVLSSFPIDFSTISVEKKKRLLSLSEELQTKMMQKVRWQQVTFPDKRVIKVGNWDLGACKQTLEDIDEIWTEILNATSLKDELRFQYYSSVKTTHEDNEIESVLAD